MAQLTPTELLARLIAHPSVSTRSNAKLVDELCQLLDGAGSTCRIWRQRAPEDDTHNLVVRLGPPAEPSERKGLVLSGHLDVVPAEEPEWQQDPFTLRTEDGRHWGRGTSDMKGFIALAVVAALRHRRTLKHPLVLLLTRDEEVGTRGARQLVEDPPFDEPLPRATVIGEPTGLRVVRMHKGHARFTVKISGRAAHSGYPHLGENAIEGAAHAVMALRALAHELRAERAEQSDFFPEVPYVPLNVGLIRGGRAVNVVPDGCQLEFGLRPLPGMDTEALFARVQRRLKEALVPGRYRSELVDESPPLCLDGDAPIHRHLCEQLGQTDTVSASYATDGGWLQRLGLDCVIWGPGSIEVAHRPNEYIALDELHRAMTVLDELIRCHCT